MCSIAENDREFQNLLSSTFQSSKITVVYHHTQFLCNIGNWTQSSLYARQASPIN